jgi:hypothetical protein
MKHYKKVTTTSTFTELVQRTCDLCGLAGKNAGWEVGTKYDIGETVITVTVLQKEGFTCPDGGSGKKYDVDICPVCFKMKLVPWLISQGAKIKQEDWDW